VNDTIPQPDPQPEDVPARPAIDDWPLAEVEDLAGVIAGRIARWEEYGYLNPPAPHCKTIPPVGERSADAITAGHGAVEAIDELLRHLHGMRGRLVDELRENADAVMARADELLARYRDGAS
jgi:hypothetical protein